MSDGEAKEGVGFGPFLAFDVLLGGVEAGDGERRGVVGGGGLGDDAEEKEEGGP